MPLSTFLVVVLIVVLLLVLTVWPYSRTYSPWPGGILAVIVFVLLILILLGYV